MTERGGASYRIKNTRWRDTSAGTTHTVPGGDVVSSGQSGRYPISSVHGRNGSYLARVEEEDYGDLNVYHAGPFSTQYRSQVAASSLANRVEEGNASRYHRERYR